MIGSRGTPAPANSIPLTRTARISISVSPCAEYAIESALTVMGAGKPGASNETVNDPVEIREWMRDACRAIAD